MVNESSSESESKSSCTSSGGGCEGGELPRLGMFNEASSDSAGTMGTILLDEGGS